MTVIGSDLPGASSLPGAIETALGKGAVDEAAALVEQAAEAFVSGAALQDLPVDRLRRWLTTLAPVGADRPWLLYYQAWIASALRQQGLASLTLDRAAAAFAAGAPGPARDRALTMVALAQATVAERDGRLGDARVAFGEARGLIGQPGRLPATVSEEDAARWRRVDPAGAVTFWLDAASTYQALAEPQALARALHNLATFTLRRGEPLASRRLAAEAVRLKAGVASLASVAVSVNALGMAERALGACEAAVDNFEEARAIGRRAGNPMIAAYALCNLAEVLADLGRHDQAGAAFAASTAEKEALGDDYALAHGWRVWARARRLDGDPEAAVELARKAWATRTPCPDPWERAELWAELGAALAVGGGPAEGDTALGEAADLARTVDAKATLAAALLGRAAALADSVAGGEGLTLVETHHLAYLAPEANRARKVLGASDDGPARAAGARVALPPRLTARLIGEFRLEVGGRPLDPRPWGNQRAAELLRCLTLHRHRLVAVDEVLEWLWPTRGPDGRSSLGTASSLIRRGLVELGASRDALRREEDRIGLGPLAWTDLDGFQSSLGGASRAIKAGRQELAVAQLEAAIEPWRAAELLPADRYASWAEAERWRLAQALARARAELVELLLALHRPEEAVLPAQEAVAADPAEEAPHRLLIRVHLARGDRAAALVALRRCRDVLNAELGQGPSAETEDLVAWDGHDRRRPSA